MCGGGSSSSSSSSSGIVYIWGGVLWYSYLSTRHKVLIKYSNPFCNWCKNTLTVFLYFPFFPVLQSTFKVLVTSLIS